MLRALRSELSLFAFGLAAALTIGWSQGYLKLAVAVYILGYLIRHLYYCWCFLAWSHGQKNELPEGNGLWTEIFHQLRLRQRRYRRRKRQLAKILKRFRQATEALPDAAVVLGDGLEIEWFNKAAAHLLGFYPKDKGLRITSLIRHPDFVNYLEHAKFGQTITIQAPSREDIQLEVRVVPYLPDHYLLLAQDVTQIRMLERQRRDFVAHASHELRTPITVIKGYLETLMDSEEASLSPTFRPVLKRMDDQLKRLQYLIDDLLYLSRLETSQNKPSAMQPVDMEQLLADIIDELDQLKEPHAPIRLQLESQKHLLGNEQELRSAFTNLIVNAVKYTPATGAITVRWHTSRQGGYLEVADTGPGIPAEHLPRLTERFYRVPGAELLNPTGTGLGLAIVKHVLNRHQGRLEVTSQIGQGSTFRCCFPAERVVQPKTAAAAP
ncbi:MAG: phosphate regulon sensor histidine kinase PhoR [Methylohalobius sp.]|nr:phosphate regulon sensor histidine kinase PhoR [Methylohalobius sp.]